MRGGRPMTAFQAALATGLISIPVCIWAEWRMRHCAPVRERNFLMMLQGIVVNAFLFAVWLAIT